MSESKSKFILGFSVATFIVSAIVLALVAVDPFTKSPEALAGAGNLKIEQYDPYIQYNGGFNTNLPMNASSTLTVTSDFWANATVTIPNSDLRLGGFNIYPTQQSAVTSNTKGILCNITVPFSATGTPVAVWFDITGATSTIIDLVIGSTTDGTVPAAGFVKTTQTDTILTYSISASAKTFIRYTFDGIIETLGIAADGATTTARASTINPAGSIFFYATTSPTAGVGDLGPAGIGGNFAATCGVEWKGI